MSYNKGHFYLLNVTVYSVTDQYDVSKDVIKTSTANIKHELIKETAINSEQSIVFCF